MEQKLTPSEQKDLILNIFADFADKPEELLDFVEHAGMRLTALRAPEDLPDMIAGHYRLKQGDYDLDRATNDLLTWPPVARAVFAKMAKQKG